MYGKSVSAWLLPAAIVLSAFGARPAPPPQSDMRVIYQYLTVVDTDGSAEFSHILKISREQMDEILEDAEYSEEEICSESTAQIENSIGRFSQEAHGEDIWCTYTVRMDNLLGLRNHLEDDFPVDVRRLEIVEDTFYLDLSWTRFPCTTSDPTKFRCEWSVKAPGAVGENNATQVAGRTLTWVMTSKDTSKRFTAESAVGGFDPTLLIVALLLLCGCCTLTLLIAGGVAVFFFLRGRDADTTATSPDAPPARELPPSPADTIKF